jgi:acyl-CoA thioester hydrolase
MKQEIPNNNNSGSPSGLGGFKIPIQIRFNDIDLLGHVNSTVYLSYFELARVSYFDQLSEELKIDWATMSFVVAKIEMEYKQQVMLEDKIYASVWVSRIGTKSYDMTCSITRNNNGVETEVAKGLAIIVCFNFKLNQSVAVPEAWKPIMIK